MRLKLFMGIIKVPCIHRYKLMEKLVVAFQGEGEWIAMFEFDLKKSHIFWEKGGDRG